VDESPKRNTNAGTNTRTMRMGKSPRVAAKGESSLAVSRRVRILEPDIVDTPFGMGV